MAAADYRCPDPVELKPLALNVIQKIASYRAPAGDSTIPGRQ